MSSTKVTNEMRGVTTTVRQNFELVFEAFYGPEAGLKIKDFTTAYQDSPQQDTNCDCGIFVMNFMSSWDGRRVAHIDNEQIYNYRVKAAMYILCHKGNTKILPPVKKLIDSEKGRTAYKKRIAKVEPCCSLQQQKAPSPKVPGWERQST